jgi:hypothetical protein
MTDSPKRRSALPHGPLIKLQENLWQVEGKLPKMALERRMCVAKLDGGGLVIHSAVTLDDEGMSALEALGPIAYLLVPSGFHRMDAAAFRERYPDAKILCPGGSRKKVSQVVDVDGSYDDLPEDGAVHLRHMEGVKGFEGVMRVAADEGTTLVFNDLFFNLPKGEGGKLVRLMGSTGGPKVTPGMLLFLIKDKKALAADLKLLAETPNLCRLVPGHGHVVEENAAQVLRDVAAQLCP